MNHAETFSMPRIGVMETSAEIGGETILESLAPARIDPPAASQNASRVAPKAEFPASSVRSA
jgi:hypothetical protein